MIMNENMCQAYDYLMESKTDPSYVKVMKWAVSYEHNSPKPNDDGSVQDSHIGNYFNNILFRAASFTEKDCQMCLIYTGKLKSNMAYGSTKVTDLRTVTIEYHINGLEEIKYICKSEPAIIKALDRNCPPADDEGASLLHNMAQECIRSVVMYPENDKHDAITFHNLSTLGLQLVKSSLLPYKIRRTGEKNSIGKAKTIPQGTIEVFKFTVPAENVRGFNYALGRAWEHGLRVQSDSTNSNEDYKVIRCTEHNQWTQDRKINDDGSQSYTITTLGQFASVFVQQVEDQGLISDLEVLQYTLPKSGKIDLSKIGGKTTSGSRSSSNKESGPTTSVTIAFEASDFDRGAKLSGALVKRYMASHPKGNAEINVDTNAQSVTITGMSKGSIEDALAFLKSKGLTFSKM